MQAAVHVHARQSKRGCCFIIVPLYSFVACVLVVLPMHVIGVRTHIAHLTLDTALSFGGMEHFRVYA